MSAERFLSDFSPELNRPNIFLSSELDSAPTIIPTLTPTLTSRPV